MPISISQAGLCCQWVLAVFLVGSAWAVADEAGSFTLLRDPGIGWGARRASIASGRCSGGALAGYVRSGKSAALSPVTTHLSRNDIALCILSSRRFAEVTCLLVRLDQQLCCFDAVHTAYPCRPILAQPVLLLYQCMLRGFYRRETGFSTHAPLYLVTMYWPVYHRLWNHGDCAIILGATVPFNAGLSQCSVRRGSVSYGHRATS